MNAADQIIWQGEKLVKDLGNKVPEDLKRELESKSAELRKAIESEDYGRMKSGTEEVQQVLYKISEKAYGQQGSGAAGFDPSQMGAAFGQQAAGGTAEKTEDDSEDVVDVDFEDLD